MVIIMITITLIVVGVIVIITIILIVIIIRTRIRIRRIYADLWQFCIAVLVARTGQHYRKEFEGEAKEGGTKGRGRQKSKGDNEERVSRSRTV